MKLIKKILMHWDDIVKFLPPVIVLFLFFNLINDFNLIEDINSFKGINNGKGELNPNHLPIGKEKLSFPFELFIDKRIVVYNAPILMHFIICLLSLGYIYILLNALIYLCNLSVSMFNSIINKNNIKNLFNLTIITLSPYIIIFLSATTVFISAWFLGRLYLHRNFTLNISELSYQDIFDIDGKFGIILFIVFLGLDLIIWLYEYIKYEQIKKEEKRDDLKIQIAIQNAKQQVFFIDIPALIVFIVFELLIFQYLFNNNIITSADLEFFEKEYKNPNFYDIKKRIIENNQVFKELFSAGAVAFSLITSQITYTFIEIVNVMKSKKIIDSEYSE
jgi:hypothetical protein